MSLFAKDHKYDFYVKAEWQEEMITEGHWRDIGNIGFVPHIEGLSYGDAGKKLVHTLITYGTILLIYGTVFELKRQWPRTSNISEH